MQKKILVRGTLRPTPASSVRDWQRWTLTSSLSPIWGPTQWVRLDELQRRLRIEYQEAGYLGDEPNAALFQTFLPDNGNCELPFSWLHRKGNGELFLFEADIVYCPFPGVTDSQVPREPVHTRDELFFPLLWAATLERFAKAGIVGIKGETVEKELVYHGVTLSGGKVPLQAKTVWHLVPFHMQRQPQPA